MEFMISPPDIVRSEHQLCLLHHWHEWRGHAALPIWPGVSAIESLVPFDHISCTKVVGLDGSARFQIESHGASSPMRMAATAASASFSMR